MVIEVLFDLKIINDIGTSYQSRRSRDVLPPLEGRFNIGVGLPFAEQRSYALESPC